MKQNKKHRSIGAKLNSTYTYKAQQKILTEWKDAWASDFTNTVGMIEKELKSGRIGAAMPLIHRLKAMSEKKFTGLDTIIKKVSDPQRILKDMPETSDPIQEQVAVPPLEEQTVNRTEKIFWAEPIQQVKEQKDLDIEEMVRCYNSGIGVRAIASDHGISTKKVIKILVTAGVYTSEKYDLIRSLRERGLSEEEVADTAGVSMKVLGDYTPYKKGIYGLASSASENAQKIRRCREQKNKNAVNGGASAE